MGAIGKFRKFRIFRSLGGIGTEGVRRRAHIESSLGLSGAQPEERSPTPQSPSPRERGGGGK